MKVMAVAAMFVAAGLSGFAQGGGTRVDELGRKLRLHDKEQRPKLDPIFAAVGQESGPVAQEMIQLRLQMVNMELAGQTATLPQVQAAYKAAAAKLTAFEVRVLTEASPWLEPRQKERIPEAFEYMAGFFQAAAPRGGGGRGRGGR
jgi:hypothetical protein